MAVTATQQTFPGYKSLLFFKRWDSPWFNIKFILGVALFFAIVSIEFIGPLFWNADLAVVGSAPTNMPPVWGGADASLGFKQPDMAHPLGTESNGRDILALLIVATPRTLRVGIIGAGIGMLIGIILGFTAGFLGGWVDNVIRIISDAIITIPGLAVLIVIASYVR